MPDQPEPFTIYGLRAPGPLRAGSLRYVGCSYNLERRLFDHCRNATCPSSPNPDLGHWIAGLGSQGLRPDVVVLEKVESEPPWRWRTRERFWIKEMRRRGHDLLNIHPGGRGSTPGPHPNSTQTRERISAAKKGRKHSPEHTRWLQQHIQRVHAAWASRNPGWRAAQGRTLAARYARDPALRASKSAAGQRGAQCRRYRKLLKELTAIIAVEEQRKG